ncbi:hypothetical protein OKW21_002065 [Catalinimonas alkaloidigena]|uniref:hypothetical protein n=1 Tax=Catalinimonas alkaloidigena TaxID=1075417 RepID=UPI0024057390|nr:hypothetical protein [Catalinimonas alkaloidigena]MDF9796802.1 hypothetical protein [Catalinimonas alkaloidigena]
MNMQGLKKIIITLLLFGLFNAGKLNAQHITMGAEAAGLAYATAALKGRSGIFANPSSLSAVRNREVFAGYYNKYGFIEGITSVSAAYLHPLANSTAAVSFTRFGDQLFSQHIVSLSYGHKIDQFSMGARLSEHQYQMEGADTRFVTVVDIGGIMQLLPSLGFGMMITNINQALVSRETEEKVPTILSSGFCYRPDEKLSTLMELSYELDERPLFKFGLAYSPLKSFIIRSGVNTESIGQFFLGLGMNHNVIDFDYALETHAYLGISQQLNVVYQLRDHGKK